MTYPSRPGALRSLLVPMMDLPPQFEDETNLWYDYDHIPDRLSCEGILFCQRMELYSVEPVGWTEDQRWMKYLHVYTLESIDVLDSPAYKLQKRMNGGRGSAWRQDREARQRAAGATRDRALRTSWIERPSPSAGRRPVGLPEPRAFLVHWRHDLGDMAEAVDDFIDNQFVPELLALPGFLGCERYEAAPHTFAKAAGGTDKFRHPKYMDIFDITTAEVLTSAVFRRFWDSLQSFDSEVFRAWTPAGSGAYVQRPSPWRIIAS